MVLKISCFQNENIKKVGTSTVRVIDEREHLPYEAVGCCKYPVLMNKSTTTGVEECGFWTTVRPDLKQTHTPTSREEAIKDICLLIIKDDVNSAVSSCIFV